MTSHPTVDLYIGTYVSETPDTITVNVSGQLVIALKPTDTRPVLLRVGDTVVSL